MKNRFLILLLVVLNPNPLFAKQSDVCRNLDQLSIANVDLEILRKEMHANDCKSFMAQGGKITNVCSWQFNFRDPVALTFFESLTNDIKRCLETTETLPKDTDVNHPDSYYLVELSSNTLNVAVSLKDKTSLEQTLVFLRVGRE